MVNDKSGFPSSLRHESEDHKRKENKRDGNDRMDRTRRLRRNEFGERLHNGDQEGKEHGKYKEAAKGVHPSAKNDAHNASVTHGHRVNAAPPTFDGPRRDWSVLVLHSLSG